MQARCRKVYAMRLPPFLSSASNNGRPVNSNLFPCVRRRREQKETGLKKTRDRARESSNKIQRGHLTGTPAPVAPCAISFFFLLRDIHKDTQRYIFAALSVSYEAAVFRAPPSCQMDPLPKVSKVLKMKRRLYSVFSIYTENLT